MRWTPPDGVLRTQSRQRTQNPLILTVVDQYGNPVYGSTVTFTVVPGDNGASGTLSDQWTVYTAGRGATVTALLALCALFPRFV